MLVVAIGAVLLGLPMMFLTSRSISDPLGQVVDAIAKAEQGDLDISIGVYERSEIGRLQSGFNRMVAGLAERERLRDLFGRHVGTNFARRAIEEGASLTGDVQEAATLFIDLVGVIDLAFGVGHYAQDSGQIASISTRIGGVPNVNRKRGEALLASSEWKRNCLPRIDRQISISRIA